MPKLVITLTEEEIKYLENMLMFRSEGHALSILLQLEKIKAFQETPIVLPEFGLDAPSKK